MDKKISIMLPVNKDVLKLTAKKLMFEMDEKQYDALLADFEILLKQIQLLNEVPNIDEAQPLCFPYDMVSTSLREDVVCDVLTTEEALKNSKNYKDGQILLPRVVK